MRNSKILRNTAILVGVLILMIFIMAGVLTSSPTSKAKDGFYVHNFDSQIADMKIVNGEKEYFAVKVQRGKYDSYYNIYDRQLNPVLETELSFAGTKVGRFLPLGNHKEQWWLLDVETLELRETDLIEPVIHESCEYMAGQRKVKGEYTWVVERIKTGEILWEGSQPVVLPSQQWYAITKADTDADSADGENVERDQIINLRTGEVEYTAKEGETIVEGGLGYWEIDYDLIWDYLGREEYFHGKYLLDENYEMAFDGQLFGSVYLNGDYICGELEQGKFMKDIDKLKFNPIGYGLKGFIWTPQGDEIYRTKQNLNVDVLGIRDNTVAIKNSRDQYEYWTIEGSGSEAAITEKCNAGKRFNYWDTEDGFMRTCTEIGKSFYQLSLGNVPEKKTSSTSICAEDYAWGFVNSNLDLIVPYEYAYASETENGFAVVKNHQGELAIIDLKKVQ